MRRKILTIILLIAFCFNAADYDYMALSNRNDSALRPPASEVAQRTIATELDSKTSSSGKKPAEYLVPDISEEAWKAALGRLGGPIVDVSMETLLVELAALPNILPESEQFLHALPMLRKLAQLPELAPLANIMNQLEDRADELQEAGLHNELQGSKGGLGILEGDSGEGYAEAVLRAQVPGVKPFIMMPMYEYRFFPKTDYDQKRQRLKELPVHYDRLIDYSNPVDYRDLVDPNVFSYPELGVNGGGEKPIKPLVDENGNQIVITTGLFDSATGGMRDVSAEIFVASRGGTPVLLIRCSDVENILYTNNEADRLNQQVLVGQVVPELCKKLGIKPAVLRLNEAHTVVAMAKMMQDEYFNDVTYVFTNHTPVVAGLQVYHGKAGWFDRLGLSPDFRDVFVDGDGNLNFSLAAMILCHLANGVSDAHGKTLKDMFSAYAPKIKGILNGTGEFWKSDTLKKAEAESDELSPSQLLNIHKQDKASLIDLIERRTSERERPNRSARPGVRLDPDMPIVGLVRRIAFYKQQYPMLKDIVRALCQDKGVESSIVIDGETIEVEGLGMQIVLGGIIVREGDDEMQSWIREFITWMDDPAFKGRFVFVSGNDVELMKTIGAGCDAWVEMPQRNPDSGHQEEACGTSGMRAFENGNIPIQSSGMWGDEAIEQYDPETGLGNGFILEKITPRELFDALVVVSGIFYKWRDEDDDRWPNLRKRAYEDAKALYIENTMMRYVLELFLPAQEAMRAEKAIRKIGPITPGIDKPFECKVGDEVEISANLSLDDISAIDSFKAEIWTNVNGQGSWEAVEMDSRRQLNADTFRFTGTVKIPKVGDYGYKVRFTIRSNGKDFYAPEGMGNDGSIHVAENTEAAADTGETASKASSPGLELIDRFAGGRIEEILDYQDADDVLEEAQKFRKGIKESADRQGIPVLMSGSFDDPDPSELSRHKDHLIFGGTFKSCIRRRISQIMAATDGTPEDAARWIVLPMFLINKLEVNPDGPVVVPIHPTVLDRRIRSPQIRVLRKYKGEERIPELIAENSRPGVLTTEPDGAEPYFLLEYDPSYRIVIRKNGKTLRVLNDEGNISFVLDFFDNEEDMNRHALVEGTESKASSGGRMLEDMIAFDQRASDDEIEGNRVYSDLKSVFDAQLTDLFVRQLHAMYEAISRGREQRLREYEESQDDDQVDLISMPHHRILAEMLFHIVGGNYQRKTRLEDYLSFAVESQERDMHKMQEIRNVIMNNYGIGEIIETTTEYSPIYQQGGVATVMAQYPNVAGRRYGLDVKVSLPLCQYVYNVTEKRYAYAREAVISEHKIRYTGKNVRIYVDGKYEEVGIYNAYINGHVVIFYDHPYADSIYMGHKGDSVTDEDRALRRIFLSKSTLEVVIEFKKNPKFIIGNDDWVPFMGFYQQEHKRYRENPALANAIAIMRWHNPVYGDDIPFHDGPKDLFRLIAEDPDNPDLIRQETTKRWELLEAFRYPENPDRISCRAVAIRYCFNLPVSKGLAASIVTPLGGTYLHDLFAARPVFGIHEAIDQHTLQRRLFGDHFIRHLKEWRACRDESRKAHLERELISIVKAKKHLIKGNLLLVYFSQLFGFSSRLLHNLDLNLDRHFKGHLAGWVEEKMTRLEKSTHMPVFLYIGRFAEMKGIHFLLEHLEGDSDNILERLIQQYPDIKFIFAGGASAGDGFGWRVFHALQGVEAKYPNNVVVRGPVAHESDEWHALVGGADGGLVPSFREPCGMVPLEEESAGTPVVASNVEGLIHGVTDVRFHQETGNGFKFDLVRNADGGVNNHETAREFYISVIDYLDNYFYHNGTRGSNKKMDQLILNCVTTDNRWSPRVEEFVVYLRSLLGVDPLVATVAEGQKDILAIPDAPESGVGASLDPGGDSYTAERVPRVTRLGDTFAIGQAIGSAA